MKHIDWIRTRKPESLVVAKNDIAFLLRLVEELEELLSHRLLDGELLEDINEFIGYAHERAEGQS